MTKTDTNITLKNLRPSLRKMSPLTFWVTVGFSWVNAAIWFIFSSVTTTVKENPVPIVNEVFPTFDHWAYIFLALGAGMALTLYLNNWSWVKRMLIIGLMAKLVWMYALIFMIAEGRPVFVTLLLWMFLAWVQAASIIHFAPSVEIKNKSLSIARKAER